MDNPSGVPDDSREPAGARAPLQAGCEVTGTKCAPVF
jgi:hypothetical protein